MRQLTQRAYRQSLAQALSLGIDITRDAVELLCSKAILNFDREHVTFLILLSGISMPSIEGFSQQGV